MPEIPFDFCGPSDQTQGVTFDNQIGFNCYCERAEVPGTRSQIALLHTPGKKVFAGLDESSVPGLFEVNGRCFAAASNLWELTPDGAFNRGSLGVAPVTPTQITANETQLVILNNGNLFVMVLATNAFQAVDMGQFNGPIAQIDFSDGYILATLQNSHTFQQSNLEDATTWSGLNISTVSLFPDNITSMKCDHREMWLYSGKKTAVYYNAGAGFPVFIPIQGAFLETGAAAAFATVQLDNSLFWLAQDERGFMVAFRANGYAGERVSTHAVELAWQQYPTVSNAVGYAYQEQGHTFWQLFFPSANNGKGATWDYDVATKYWHQRGSWDEQSGTYSADRSMSHTFCFGLNLVGDWASGNVYQLSSNILTENGNPIRGFRRTPTVSDSNKWIYFESIEFDVETGLGPNIPLNDGTGATRPPQIILRWSNDGGKTWSNDYILSLGATGKYSKRVIKRMLGRARKRIWEVSWSDPVPIRFVGAYLYGEAAIN
jgi:hypothetical protein